MSSLGPSVIRFFKTGTYDVHRRGPPTMLHGRATPATPTVLNIEGMLAPLGGREVIRIPEGERSTERRIFLCEVKLRSSGPDGPADVLWVDDEGWEVERIEDWMQLGGFFKAILVKVDD